MSQDEDFNQKWDFRRKDADSSSDDKGSSLALHQGQKESAPVLSLPVPDNDDQEEETSPNQGLPPPEPAETQPSVPQNTQDKPTKKKQRRAPKAAKTQKTKRVSKKPGKKEKPNVALNSLEIHVNLLVKDLSSSRERLIKYMSDELDKLYNGASPSKPARKGKTRQRTKKPGKGNESGKTKRKANADSSNTTNPETLSIVAPPEQQEVHVEQPSNSSAAPRSTVIALPENSSGRKPSLLSVGDQSNIVLSGASNRTVLTSNYLGLPNLNPRPLAENYLDTPTSSTLRIQPVLLNPRGPSMQQQSTGFHQGVPQLQNTDFPRIGLGSMGGLNRSVSIMPSGSVTNHGGLSSGGYLGLGGELNIANARNVGVGGSGYSVQNTNFPSLRMMNLLGGSSHGGQVGDMNSNQLRFSN